MQTKKGEIQEMVLKKMESMKRKVSEKDVPLHYTLKGSTARRSNSCVPPSGMKPWVVLVVMQEQTGGSFKLNGVKKKGRCQ